MSHYPLIDILLATYNGECYLDEQIQSLLSQTYSHWRLLIRDDGSTDNTPAIIHSYAEKYPNKIIVIKNSARNLGACGNFGALLEHATGDYVMFCDQDDVWLQRKIESTLRKMMELVDQYGNNIPLLVFTDMQVVDKDLNIIADSYWKYQAFAPESGNDFSRMLVSNVIIGCTSMMNRKLWDLAVPLSGVMLMHDWWAGLVSVALGKNGFIDEPTVLYRQHVLNVVGATWKMSFSDIINKLMDVKKHRQYLLKSQMQARAFADRYGHLLSPVDLKKARIYAGLDSHNWIIRRYDIFKYGFWWSGVLRNITLLLIV